MPSFAASAPAQPPPLAWAASTFAPGGAFSSSQRSLQPTRSDPALLNAALERIAATVADRVATQVSERLYSPSMADHIATRVTDAVLAQLSRSHTLSPPRAPTEAWAPKPQ